MAFSNAGEESGIEALTDSMHHLGVYDVDVDFYSRLQRNRRVSDATFYLLLVTYVFLMVFGMLSNGLVIWVVVRQRSRRQLHQLLMINLALSDLLLCILTMPLTLMEIVTFSWPLGNYPFLCRLTGCVQAISVYVSTLTIAAIALDRYHLIVHPTRTRLRAIGGLALVVFIWLVSIFNSLIPLNLVSCRSSLELFCKITPWVVSVCTIASFVFLFEDFLGLHATYPIWFLSSIFCRYFACMTILMLCLDRRVRHIILFFYF